MKRKYRIDALTGAGIDELIAAVEEYEQWLNRKCKELAERLASMGALNVEYNFTGVMYSGSTDHEVTVEEAGENRFVVKLEGESVLFIEFGAGARYGYGHPEVGNYGPGTYPGKGHWDDPNGWWYKTDDASAATRVTKKTGQAWVHTYGNPPNAPVYNAVKELEEDIAKAVREVFSS